MRGVFPRRVIIIVLFAVVAPLLSLSPVSTRCFIVVMVAAGLLIAGNVSPRTRAFLGAGMAALSGLVLLDKFSVGVISVAVTVVAVVVGRGTRMPRILIPLVVLPLTVLGAWWAAGQQLADLAVWAGRSSALAAGYPDAMSTEMPGTAWQYLGLVAAGGAIVVVTIRSSLPGRSRWGLLLLELVVLLAALRMGFTRHDAGHPISSFAIVALLALTAAGMIRSQRLIAAALAAALLSGASAGVSYWSLVDPIAATTHLASAVDVVVSQTSAESALQTARAQLQSAQNVDPAVVAPLEGHRVAADPWEISAVWGRSLSWLPVPFIQPYSAYTNEFDALNAESLTSEDGPDAVLKSEAASIDYRNPMWESPRYVLSLLCNYRAVAEVDRWSALVRSTNRCGTARQLGTTTAIAGVPVDIPELPSNGIVTVQVDLPESKARRLSTLLFKPRDALYLGLDAGQYRLPRAFLGAPLVVRVSPSSGWSTRMRGTGDAATISLPEDGRVTFSFTPFE
jgi:hypothetical protein